MYIYSFSSLSYDRSKASSKASSPHSAIHASSFEREYLLLSLRLSSSFLRLLLCLPEVVYIHIQLLRQVSVLIHRL